MRPQSRAVSVKDIIGNAELKKRHFGEGSSSKPAERADLKRALDRREDDALLKREKKDGGSYSTADAMTLDEQAKALKWLQESNQDKSSSSSSSSSEDDEGEEVKKKPSGGDGGGRWGGSDSGSSSSSDEEDDDDDEEELLRELEKIKKERAKEAEMKQRAQEEKEQQDLRESAATSNPLMQFGSSSKQTVTKSWYEDTIFRNQAKTNQTEKKRFVNDTVRSDFHRKFLDRYVK